MILLAVVAVLLLCISIFRPRVLIYLSILLSPTQWITLELGNIFVSPADLIVSIGSMGLILRLFLRQPDSLRALLLHKYLWLMLIFYGLGCIYWSKFPPGLLRVVQAFLLSALLCEQLVQPEQIAKACVCFVVSGGISLTYGIARVLLGEGWLGRFEAFGNPNYTGMYLISSGLVALGLYLQRCSGYWLAVIGVLFVSGMATLSQSNIIALLMAGLLIIGTLRGIVRKISALVTLGLLMAVLLSNEASLGLIWERNAPEKSAGELGRSSIEARILVLRAALELALEYPLLGVGYNESIPRSTSDPEIALITQGAGISTHNTYVEVLVEGGVLAFAALMIHVTLLGRRLLRYRGASADGKALWVNPGVIAFPFMLITALNINLLPIYGFWVVCSLAAASSSLPPELPDRVPSPVKNGMEVEGLPERIK